MTDFVPDCPRQPPPGQRRQRSKVRQPPRSEIPRFGSSPSNVGSVLAAEGTGPGTLSLPITVRRTQEFRGALPAADRTAGSDMHSSCVRWHFSASVGRHPSARSMTAVFRRHIAAPHQLPLARRFRPLERCPLIEIPIGGQGTPEADRDPSEECATPSGCCAAPRPVCLGQ